MRAVGILRRYSLVARFLFKISITDIFLTILLLCRWMVSPDNPVSSLSTAGYFASQGAWKQPPFPGCRSAEGHKKSLPVCAERDSFQELQSDITTISIRLFSFPVLGLFAGVLLPRMPASVVRSLPSAFYPLFSDTRGYAFQLL